MPPSVAGGTHDQPAQPSQQQPCPNRSTSFAPEGAHDDIEIVFMDDHEVGSLNSADNNRTANHHEDDPDVANPHEDLFGLPDPDQYGRGKRRKKPNRHLSDEHL